MTAAKNEFESWADLIRAEIDATGISTSELARLSGVNQSNIYRFLYEGADLRLSSAEAIGRALGLELKRRR